MGEGAGTGFRGGRETHLNNRDNLGDALGLERSKEGLPPRVDVRLVREEKDDVVGRLAAVERRVEVAGGREEELERGLEARGTDSGAGRGGQERGQEGWESWSVRSRCGPRAKGAEAVPRAQGGGR